MKVEHVLLFLVGAFALHYLMGNCGCRVESFDLIEYAKGLGYLNPPMLVEGEWSRSSCPSYKINTYDASAGRAPTCADLTVRNSKESHGECNKYYEKGGFFNLDEYLCKYNDGDNHCSRGKKCESESE